VVRSETVKIYLAARYSRNPEMRDWAKILTNEGHEITSRWINGGHELSDVATDRDRARLAREDFHDLLQADVVIAFTEEPRKPSNQRGGRHVEFGIALAYQKRIIIYGSRENVFHFMPGIKQCDTQTQLELLLHEIKYE
jgi:nucleoside 2-deoxyribosyltransferase